jgi:hypothetical protein
MKFSEIDNLALEFHEVQITIDNSENYAEIVEVYRESENGPGFVIVTSVKAIEPHQQTKHRRQFQEP